LDRLDELWRVAVAGVVAACRVDDADHGAVQRRIGEAGALDERATQEKREVGVAVAGEPLAQAAGIAACRAAAAAVLRMVRHRRPPADESTSLGGPGWLRRAGGVAAL